MRSVLGRGGHRAWCLRGPPLVISGSVWAAAPSVCSSTGRNRGHFSANMGRSIGGITVTVVMRVCPPVTVVRPLSGRAVGP